MPVSSSETGRNGSGQAEPTRNGGVSGGGVTAKQKAGPQTKTGRARSAASRKAAARRRRNRKKKAGQVDVTVEAILMTALLLFCIIMLIGSYGLGGFIGSVLGTMEYGLFGILCHFFPVLVYMGAFFLLTNHTNRLAYKKMAAVMGLYGLCCGLAQVLTEGFLPGYGVMDYYARSADYHVGGGGVGGILCMTLTNAFGKVGSIILIAILMLACLIIIAKRSLVDFIVDLIDRIFGGSPQEGIEEEAAAKELRRQEREEAKKHRQEERIRRKEEKYEARIARENASEPEPQPEPEPKPKEKDPTSTIAGRRAEATGKTPKVAQRAEEPRSRVRESRYVPVSERNKVATEAALQQESGGRGTKKGGYDPKDLDIKSRFRMLEHLGRLKEKATNSLKAIQDDDDWDDDFYAPQEGNGAPQQSQEAASLEKATKTARSRRTEEGLEPLEGLDGFEASSSGGQESPEETVLVHHIEGRKKSAFSSFGSPFRGFSKRPQKEDSDADWLEDNTVDMEPTFREVRQMREASRKQQYPPQENDPFLEAQELARKATSQNPSLGEAPMDLGNIGLIGEDDEDY